MASLYAWHLTNLLRERDLSPANMKQVVASRILHAHNRDIARLEMEFARAENAANDFVHASK